MDRPTGNFESPFYRRFATRMTAFPVVHASGSTVLESSRPTPARMKSLKGIVAGQYFLPDAPVSQLLCALRAELMLTLL